MKVFLAVLFSILFSLSAAAESLYVKQTSDGFLNLREGPGSNYNIIRRMYPGDDLRLLDAKGDWRQVELQNGIIGWAHARYLQD